MRNPDIDMVMVSGVDKILLLFCAVTIMMITSCDLVEICDKNEYLVDGKCIPCKENTHVNASGTGCDGDSDKECGDVSTDCTKFDKNAYDVGCKDAKCFIYSCRRGYHLRNNECLVGCNFDTDCETAENAESMSCLSGGRCVINECKAGYSKEIQGDGAYLCVEKECTVETADKDCKLGEHATVMECFNGKCRIKKCDAKYLPIDREDGSVVCEPDLRECWDDTEDEDCELAKSAASMKCVDHECRIKECIEGYLLENDGTECVKDESECKQDSDCNDRMTEHVKSLKCNTDYKIAMCEATECDDDKYEPSGQECVKTSDCVSSNECKLSENAVEMECSAQDGKYRKCLIKSCGDKFVLTDDKLRCEPDNAECHEDADCTSLNITNKAEMQCSNRKCSVKSCDPGYYENTLGSSCVKCEDLGKTEYTLDSGKQCLSCPSFANDSLKAMLSNFHMPLSESYDEDCYNFLSSNGDGVLSDELNFNNAKYIGSFLKFYGISSHKVSLNLDNVIEVSKGIGGPHILGQISANNPSISLDNTFVSKLSMLKLLYVKINSGDAIRITGKYDCSSMPCPTSHYNHVLTEIKLPRLETVIGNIFITFLRGLETLSLDSLKTISGSFTFKNNTGKTISMPNLETISGNVNISYNFGYEASTVCNPRYSNFNMATSNGYVITKVLKDQSLQTIDMPKLKSIGGSVTLDANTQIQNIQMDSLETVGGAFHLGSVVPVYPYNEDELLPLEKRYTECPEYYGIIGGFPCFQNNMCGYDSTSIGYTMDLTKLNFPKLKTIGGDFSVETFTRLTEVNMPELTTIVGKLEITYPNSITKISMPKLNSVGGALSFWTEQTFQPSFLENLNMGAYHCNVTGYNDSGKPNKIECTK